MLPTLLTGSLLLTLAAPPADAPGMKAFDPVIEPEGLAAALADPAVRVLDVRKAEDYDASRVRGAVRLDLSAWNAVARATGGTPDLGKLAEVFGSAGLDAHTPVIIYDAGGMTASAAAWFLLQLAGADQARIVNGGFKAVQAAAPSLVTTEPTPPPAKATFVPDPSRGLVEWTDKSELKEITTKGGAKVWDARTADEYAGKELRDNKRGGHLPNAVNLAHAALIGPDGRLRSAEDLRASLLAKGFKPGDRIVAHCQSGARSSLAALAAVRAGFGPIENYYMSFGEWSADETCRVVKPE
jgi:thiosulfate/3-mercaptopyruvate sulfurtransferase